MMIMAVQIAGSCAMLALLCISFVPYIVFVPIALLLLSIGIYRHRGRAIWIENDRIFYRDASLLGAVSRDMRDVVDVELGQEDTWSWPVWHPALIIKFRGNGEAKIHTFPLTANGSVIRARLRDALGLPKTT
jgi:hypothetical protein